METNKIWDKGYAINRQVEIFTVGSDRELDLHLAMYDIIGSMAHAVMLSKSGLISKTEAGKILKVLRSLYNKSFKNEIKIEEKVEDIHSQIEIILTEKLGSTGQKIHTGRSRNDQVLTDLRLYYRDQITGIAEKAGILASELLNKAEQYSNDFMPGYTHMQIAMISSYGLWFASWAESLINDLLFLQTAYTLNNQNPLGTAAGYGTNLPVNRELTTELLGFSDMNIVSPYAQLSRIKNDIVLADSLASIAWTLGKMCTDIILYSNQNFAFFKLKDDFTTGSSIMPQKKNPDIAEVLRARCNRIQSLPAEIKLMSSNLNSGYHRDMQLLKESVIPSINSMKECLQISHMMIKGISVNPTILRDPLYNPLLSTNEVNRLVIKGVPFREAYKKVAATIGKQEFSIPALNEYTHTGSPGNPGVDILSEKLKSIAKNFPRPDWDAVVMKIIAAGKE